MAQGDAITVCISRTVKPGCEADFERALHGFVQRSLSLPGQHGVHIMRPAPGSGLREYGIIRKFANRDALATSVTPRTPPNRQGARSSGTGTAIPPGSSSPGRTP